MNNRRYYDAVAPDFSRRETRAYHRFLNDVTAEILSQWLPSGRILDMGCGAGHLAKRMANAQRTITGLDVSRNMLLACRSGASTHTAVSSVNPDISAAVVSDSMNPSTIPVIQASIDAIPFVDECFDGAYAMRVFPHVSDPATALAELARVIRPGGIIALDVYNPLSLRYLVKRLQRIGKVIHLEDLLTHFDGVKAVREWLPDDLRYSACRGIRVITPVGAMMDWPWTGQVLLKLERWSSNSALGILGGFLMLRLEKL